MASNAKILLIGATGKQFFRIHGHAVPDMVDLLGYIGGSVLSLLLAHPRVAASDISVLVRSQAKAEKLREFGLHVVVGSTDDHDQLESLAATADVVFSCVRSHSPLR